MSKVEKMRSEFAGIEGNVQTWIEGVERISLAFRVPYRLVSARPRPKWRERPLWRLRALIWRYL